MRVRVVNHGHSFGDRGPFGPGVVRTLEFTEASRVGAANGPRPRRGIVGPQRKRTRLMVVPR